MVGKIARDVSGLLWLLPFAVSCFGCSSDPGVVEDEVTTDLRQIARAYETVMVQTHKPPKDIEQVRDTIAALHEANILGDPAEVLVSSRDGQPYVIIPGVELGASNSSEILIYEKEGAEGERYVLMTSRDVRKIPDADFAKASFAMGHKPAGK